MGIRVSFLTRSLGCDVRISNFTIAINLFLKYDLIKEHVTDTTHIAIIELIFYPLSTVLSS